ncbi:MAG: mechanosensitive ion channel domain-containing protein [Nannocystaceae bacterium]
MSSSPLQITKEILSIELFELSGTRVTIVTAITVLLILVATVWGSRLVRRGLELWFQRRGVQSGGSVHAISRLVHYLVVFIGFGIALQTLGISMGGLFAAGAVFAVGVGFAMQNIAQNFVSGIILLVERSIKKNDIVLIEGQLVRVEQLGIRSTIVQNRDGLDLIVPNSTIVQSTVTNYTLVSSKYRIRITVGVTYGSDMDLVRSTLEEVASELASKWGQTDRQYQVVMDGFGSSSVDFQIAVWIDDPWQERVALSNLCFAVWHALKRNDIVIAFPQVDVHFDPPIESSFATLAAVR